ncbi:hypothetical protein FPZ12_002130 [Amycolatopsis acidicola]|uniref:Uncharacterized protein n=1 Tax=Amycolatopsis acidicola TaxID=2596893 RepID=A0A5N0VNL4_9PSEU|nr:hypothetical protein [Amycolatopsis acidicola]KAA9166382.1 hypothetical protein FPZ12_002130 [Amycolatopsis acidicola]
MLNAVWIAAFSHRLFVVSEVVIVALLGTLVTALVRLRAVPAEGWGDRLLVHTTVGLYTGWVGVAAVAGAATTGAALGTAPSAPVSVAAVVLTVAAAIWVAFSTRAVAGFALAVAWALVWIAVATDSPAVAVVTVAAVLVFALACGFRVLRGRDRAGVAAG